MAIVRAVINTSITSVPGHTTQTIHVTVTASPAFTAGNTLVVGVGALAVFAGNSCDTPSVTDNLGSTYTQKVWGGSVVQQPGAGIFVLENIPFGINSVTFSCVAVNSNFTFTADTPALITVGEFSGLGASPSDQGHFVQTNNASSPPMNFTITDSVGNVVVTGVKDASSHNPNQTSAAIIDLANGGEDDFVVVVISNTIFFPSITSPGGYGTYVQDAIISGGFAGALWTLIHTPPLAIACSSPPVGAVGQAYSHAFPANGGTPPYTFSIASGSLPTGLSLNTSTGVVSGTPSAAGTFPFVIKVTDAASATASVSCSITINAQLAVTCASPPSGIVGVPYSHTFPATGGIPPYFFAISAGALPNGLSINGTTGVVSGTPTTPGTFNFTVQVTDSGTGIATVACTIIITGSLGISCASPPSGTVGTPYSHAFPASGGSSPYTFAIISGSLPGGLSLNTSSGVVSGTPTTAGTFPFTIQVTDSLSNTANVACSIAISGTLNISCNNPPAGTVGIAYSHQILAGGGTPPYSFSIISGSLPNGLTIDSSTGLISGTPTTNGNFPFTVQVTDSVSATASVACSITISGSLAGSCNNPPTGLVGSAYSHTLTASGGTAPYTFTLSSGSLPTGLSMDSTGLISGTPTQTGTFAFSVLITDTASRTASINCSIQILGNLNGNCASPPFGVVGTPYTHAFTASGGQPPYTFSIITGSLPAGLTMSSSGSVSGTPTTPGTSFFTVHVADSGTQSVNFNCSITINPQGTPISLDCNNPPVGIVGQVYAHSLAVNGGIAPYTFALIAGSLPSGLTLATQFGTISGTPEQSGSFTITIQVTDSQGATAVVVCTITINATPPPIPPPPEVKFKLYSDSRLFWAPFGAAQKLETFFLTERERQESGEK